MSTIVTRSGKGSTLSWAEMDANLTNLNTDKVEASSLGDAALLDVGTTAGTVAAGDHLHTGTYEPADATILKTANIGSTVQAYDVDTAKLDVAQAWTQPQRAFKSTVSSLTFDLSTGQDFTITVSGSGALTFTNNVSGQHGTIWFNNTGGYIITEGTAVFTENNFFSTISAAGTYVISYWCHNTNIALTTTGNLS